MGRGSPRQTVRELLTPKQVGRAIGVSEASLKRWCDKGLLPTVRTVGGHRRLPLNGVLQFLRETKQPIIRPEILGLPAISGLGETVISHATEKARLALEAGDDEQLQSLLFNLYLAGHSICDLCDRVLAPAFEAIGDRWAHGSVEVYQERRAVEITRRALFMLSQALPHASSAAPRAFGGTVEHDPYILGTSMAELVLREVGWNAESFGAHHPFATLRAAIEQQRPRLVWLSVSWIEHVPEFIAEFATLYTTAQRCDALLVVGGRALTEPIRRQLSYSSYCDTFRHLVDFARQHAPRAAASSEAAAGTAPHE